MKTRVCLKYFANDCRGIQNCRIQSWFSFYVLEWRYLFGKIWSKTQICQFKLKFDILIYLLKAEYLLLSLFFTKLVALSKQLFNMKLLSRFMGQLSKS